MQLPNSFDAGGHFHQRLVFLLWFLTFYLPNLAHLKCVGNSHKDCVVW